MIIEKPSRTYAWFYDVTTRDIEVNRGEGIGAHKVLAGSPIDENGNVANDETAIGLLMETVSDANPDGKIIVAGDVDALGAKNASGIDLTDAAKNALVGITWREQDYVVEMQAGGGGWPADLPKPSVGGYGYTESGEQTVITWDGDTEGRENIQNTFYKVSDLTPPESAISNGEVVFSDVGTGEPVGSGEKFGDIVMMYASKSIIVATSSGQIVTEDETVDIPSAGLYFVKEDSGFVASLTYGTPDTIHKIDEKYLPEAGGGGNDFIIEMPRTTGSLTQDTIAQLDAIKEFIAGNMDKKEPYTVKCYVPHPSGGTAIIDCSVKYQFYDVANKPSVRITGSQLANMTYTEYGLEFYCIDFHQEGAWTPTSTPPWQYVLKTVGLEINSI